jgi:dTDP-4-dehydrorhamnose reductase
MLARDLCPALEESKHEVIGLDLPDLDIRQQDQITLALSRLTPDIVINCAAYTNVDQAESDSDLAFAVNRDGAFHLARACSNLQIPLIHISTDYVFDGNARRPYREDDEATPLGVYGMSKLQGETAVRSAIEQHYIVRTAWLYGIHGKNFVKTILSHGKIKPELRVVSDQHGCPTWTRDLAEAIRALVAEIERGTPAPWGTYHFCGRGITTWHGFAESIIEEGRKYEALSASRIFPIPTEEYPTAAQRPLYSALDCQKFERALGIRPPAWQDSLKLMLAALYTSKDSRGVS